MFLILLFRYLPYILGVVAVVSLLGGAYWYVDNNGYKRAEAKWSLKYNQLITDYGTAESKEIARQAEANEFSRVYEESLVKELEANEKRINELEALNDEAISNDPDSSSDGLKRDGVRRLNRIR